MKTKMQFENIRIFAVETSFSSFPSYVICTAERVNDREYRGESFLLHINNAIKARLIAKEVLIQSENMNSELFSDIDDDFVIYEKITTTQQQPAASDQVQPEVQLSSPDLAEYSDAGTLQAEEPHP